MSVEMLPIVDDTVNQCSHSMDLGVHVMQWRLLGTERFIAAYPAGLEQFGYRNSPLEVMAYGLEERFKASPDAFGAEKAVAASLTQLT